MRWISIGALVTILAIGGGLRAEECCQAKLKTLEARIAKLVEGWNAAGKQHPVMMYVNGPRDLCWDFNTNGPCGK